MKIVRGGFGFRNKQGQHALGANGDDVVLILKNSFDGQKALAGQQQAILMKQVRRDDGIGHPGFIFQADEDESLGGSRALAGNDAASDAETPPAGNVAQFNGTANAHGIEPRATVRHGMWADGETRAVKIGDQALFVVQGLERRRRIGFRLLFEQRSGDADGAFHLPERIAAVKI